MIFIPRQKEKRRVSFGVMMTCACVVLVILLAACGTATGGGGTTPGATANPQTPTVTPPNDLLTSGTLTVGSDTTY
ncbi:MAG TPA: hypothetical protein VGT44_11830, partial [Ktedonobacteraceae bacterium]|nr:hypothetical protein [Ktedonobacteraceae bacterium]